MVCMNKYINNFFPLFQFGNCIIGACKYLVRSKRIERAHLYVICSLSTSFRNKSFLNKFSSKSSGLDLSMPNQGSAIMAFEKRYILAGSVLLGSAVLLVCYERLKRRQKGFTRVAPPKVRA